MNDYCVGVAYGTGYFCVDEGKRYLVVRNLDRWYVDIIAKETGYTAYESYTNFDRDKKPQWIVKARSIQYLPKLSEIQCKKDFCRAYIELHGSLDIATARNRDGSHFQKPRLRIYGREDIISFINEIVPANKKKIQYITNCVDEKYTGNTCVIYYQSKREIFQILEWINGNLKNRDVWDRWYNILNLFQ